MRILSRTYYLLLILSHPLANAHVTTDPRGHENRGTPWFETVVEYSCRDAFTKPFKTSTRFTTRKWGKDKKGRLLSFDPDPLTRKFFELEFTHSPQEAPGRRVWRVKQFMLTEIDSEPTTYELEREGKAPLFIDSLGNLKESTGRKRVCGKFR